MKKASQAAKSGDESSDGKAQILSRNFDIEDSGKARRRAHYGLLKVVGSISC